MKKLLLALSFCAVLVVCKTPKQTTEPKPEATAPVETTAPVEVAAPVETQPEVAVTAPATQDSLFVYLERTPCYGQCPMYKFKIYNSGYALYEGKRFVEKLGTYEAHIAAPVLEEIKAKTKTANYFEFRDEYPKKASDFPSTKTTIIIDGKRKDVMNGSGAPAALRDFEAYLDSVKDGSVWKQVH